MQNKLKTTLTLIFSVFIHLGVFALINRLANQISTSELISITAVDITAQNSKPQQNAKAIQKKEKPISKLTSKLTSVRPVEDVNENVNSSVTQLGADEISSQGQISSPAKLISVVRAQRTPEAKKANYVADAKLLIIVNQQGVVDSAKLLNSLEYGLNEVALDIAEKLKFRPARIGFNAVRTQIELTISFKSSN